MKFKKWWIILIVIIVILILIIVYFLLKPYKVVYEKVIACKTNDNCVLTLSGGCCNGVISINKKYNDYWNKFKKSDESDCSNIKCQQFDIAAYEPTCINNKCEAREKPRL